METYEKMKADIIFFESEDIIRTSNNISIIGGDSDGEDFED